MADQSAAVLQAADQSALVSQVENQSSFVSQAENQSAAVSQIGSEILSPPLNPGTSWDKVGLERIEILVADSRSVGCSHVTDSRSVECSHVADSGSVEVVFLPPTEDFNALTEDLCLNGSSGDPIISSQDNGEDVEKGQSKYTVLIPFERNGSIGSVGSPQNERYGSLSSLGSAGNLPTTLSGYKNQRNGSIVSSDHVINSSTCSLSQASKASIKYADESDDNASEGSAHSEDLGSSSDSDDANFEEDMSTITVDLPEVEKNNKEDVETILPPEDVEGEGEQLKVTKIRLFALALLGVTMYLCGAAMSILAPFYTSEAVSHGLSVTASSTVFATVFILQIVFTPIFGRYITRIGSVTLLITGSILSGLANIGFGFVPLIGTANLFFGISVLMRGITALGESAINTAVYPLAGMMAPSKYSTTVLSCMETMFGVGTMTGPFFGGLMYQSGGFLLPFLVVGILQVVCGIGSGVLIYCMGRERRKRIREEKEINGGITARIIPTVKFKQIIKKPGVIVSAIITILAGMSTQWYQPTLEPYLSANFSITAFKASMFLVIDGTVYAVVSPIWGVLLDKRLNIRILMMFGCATICISFLLMGPFFYPNSPTLLQIGISLALHGVGMGANCIGSLAGLTSEISKGKNINKLEAHGLATSIWITAENIGSFLGSSLGGLTYDVGGWDLSCLIIALIQIGGLFMVVIHSLCLRLEEDGRLEEKESLLTKKTTNYGGNNNNEEQTNLVV